MENFTNVISDLGSLIQNSITRVVRVISGPNEVSELGELKEAGNVVSMGGACN